LLDCLLGCLLVCLFACLFVCLFVCLFACLRACLFVCLCVCVLVCLVGLFVCVCACLLGCLLVCLFASLCACLFACLFACLLVCVLVGKGAAQAEIGLLRCAVLPGTLGPWPLRPWHLDPEREPLQDILDSQRDKGIPNGTRLQSAGLGRRMGQGKIAKSRARQKDREGKARRSGPRGQEPQAKSLDVGASD
jgi:hypothetical protein